MCAASAVTTPSYTPPARRSSRRPCRLAARLLRWPSRSCRAERRSAKRRGPRRTSRRRTPPSETWRLRRQMVARPPSQTQRRKRRRRPRSCRPSRFRATGSRSARTARTRRWAASMACAAGAWRGSSSATRSFIRCRRAGSSSTSSSCQRALRRPPTSARHPVTFRFRPRAAGSRRWPISWCPPPSSRSTPSSGWAGSSPLAPSSSKCASSAPAGSRCTRSTRSAAGSGSRRW
mmetsp:Transcript_14497/g.38550  ORF Transcript_14497/g.38550 Transcript_14497/m.38550 type:complete len:233 (+) Transcript_14497:979-1677(+)